MEVSHLPLAYELKKPQPERRVKFEWYLQMYRALYMFLWWVVVLHHQTHHQSLLQVLSSQSPGFALLCNCHRGCSREEKHSNYSNQPQQQGEPLGHQAWDKGKQLQLEQLSDSRACLELAVTTDKWEPSLLPLKAVKRHCFTAASEGAVTQLITVRQQLFEAG